MSHRGVEIVLGRLVTDEIFRRLFAQDPGATLLAMLRSGLELNSVELAALSTIDPAAIRRFARALDPRLLKAALGVEHLEASHDDPSDEEV